MSFIKLFERITVSGVGYGGSTLLILAQLFLSLFFEIKFLFASMRNRSLLVKTSVSLIPLVLMATYCIAAGILFSAFLDRGPDPDGMAEIIGLTLTGACVTQMLGVTGIFFALAFKVFVLALSLLLGLLLRERKPRPPLEDDFMDRRSFYEKSVLRHLTRDDLLVGCSVSVFVLAAGGFIACMLLHDESARWNLETFFTIFLLSLLFIPLLILGLFLMRRGLWPKTAQAYRQLLSMGDKNTVLRLFYEEIVSRAPVPTRSGFNQTILTSRHFILRTQGIRTQVVWTGDQADALPGPAPDRKGAPFLFLGFADHIAVELHRLLLPLAGIDRDHEGAASSYAGSSPMRPA